MPKKKMPVNAFSIFLDEKKRLNPGTSKAELAQIYHNEYKDMPEQNKLIYKEKANQLKRKPMELCDSRGIPLHLIEAEDRRNEEKKSQMENQITTLVDELCTENNKNEPYYELKNYTFLHIYFNYFVHTDDDHYHPSEVAVCKYNFSNGLMDEFFHAIFEDDLPTGYAYEAREHSKSTHHLYLNSKGDNPKKFAIIKNLLEFVKFTSNKPIVLYTSEDMISQVEKCLLYFDDKNSGFGCISQNFLIHSLDLLYYSISNKTQKTSLSKTRCSKLPLSIASDHIKSITFETMPSLACKWHREMMPDASRFCALTFTRKWFYNIVNRLSIQLGINYLEGGKNMRPEPDVEEDLSSQYDTMSLISSRSSYGGFTGTMTEVTEEDSDDVASQSGFSVTSVETCATGATRLSSASKASTKKSFPKGLRNVPEWANRKQDPPLDLSGDDFPPI